MDNYRGSTISHQGTNTNNSNQGGKNRNRKKKNKQQNHNTQQNNQNMPLSPSKTLINHYTDYGGSMSLGTVPLTFFLNTCFNLFFHQTITHTIVHLTNIQAIIKTITIITRIIAINITIIIVTMVMESILKDVMEVKVIIMDMITID